MGIKKYKFNQDFFNYDSEELWYFYGFIASDGYVADDRISLTLNENDVDVLINFRDLICPDRPLVKKEKVSALTLNIFDKNICKHIKNIFGMSSNKKSKEIQFPKNIPENYVKDFIRGVIDGDGCIDTTKAYQKNKVYVGARLRILGRERFLRELNEISKKFVQHNTNSVLQKGKEDVFCVTYNFSTAVKLLNWIYKDNSISLDRKNKKYLEVINLKR